MVDVKTLIEGQEVVASSSFVLSDDYRFSIVIEGQSLEFRLAEDENVHEPTAEHINIDERKSKYTLTNWGKKGIPTTGELERVLTVGSVDYNISLAITSIIGSLKSRLVTYTIWPAGQSAND